MRVLHGRSVTFISQKKKVAEDSVFVRTSEKCNCNLKGGTTVRLSLKTMLCLATVLALTGGIAFAEGQPAAKATAKVGTIALVEGPTGSGSSTSGWVSVLSNTLKTSSQKDLFVDASLECGLLTRTLVKSKSGTSDTSIAQAAVEVRVKLDPGTTAEKVFEPGDVIFCRRSQELTAVFAGILSDCTDEDGDGTIEIPDECTITEEELELILDTMNANSFNFILDDVGVGVHEVDVQARINLGPNSAGAGSTESKGLIGKGSVTVEEVRLIQGEDILL